MFSQKAYLWSIRTVQILQVFSGPQTLSQRRACEPGWCKSVRRQNSRNKPAWGMREKGKPYPVSLGSSWVYCYPCWARVRKVFSVSLCKTPCFSPWQGNQVLKSRASVFLYIQATPTKISAEMHSESVCEIYIASEDPPSPPKCSAAEVLAV